MRENINNKARISALERNILNILRQHFEEEATEIIALIGSDSKNKSQ